MPDKHYMTPDAAARIQSAEARNGGDMSSGGFAARAQSAGAHDTNSGAVQQSSRGNLGNSGCANWGPEKK
ncbi:hypothetical protein VSDG_04385 [Cytospora chrysosperma]|uniref:SMP domain-containing protein n=1 Tax=Cytospora chrysosperma TaxID=252740 RepID=A0A423W4E9_CYTCH|nr:hypothetical protein VSDG_04385 [Valsa sordida]